MKTPINRLFTLYFKADGGRIERPQYFRLDNTGQQGLEVTNIAFNTTTQVVGDYQQSMHLSHEKVIENESWIVSC